MLDSPFLSFTFGCAFLEGDWGLIFNIGGRHTQARSLVNNMALLHELPAIRVLGAFGYLNGTAGTNEAHASL